MDDGRDLMLIFLIGFVLPVGIFSLVAVGYFIKLIWDIDEVGCFRRLILWGGIFILTIILLLIGFISLG